MRTPLLPLLLLLLASGTACGPVGPVPGGRLRGDLAQPAVADWSFSDAHQQVELETNPGDPHSVHTWCATLGDRLYVPTSMIRGPKDPGERAWVRNVLADPRVRLRIGAGIHERRAVRVEDRDEYAAALAALDRKYGRDPAERDPERTIWIFRMDPVAP